MFRLFVYYSEAGERDDSSRQILQDQFKIMMKRLWYIITWPSSILTLLFGLLLLAENSALLQMGYMHIKLGFVALLFVYQFYGESLLRSLLKGGTPKSSMGYRFLNEVPTLILIAVVFLIIKKNSIDWIWGSLGIIGIAVLLTIAIKLYKKWRDS